MEYRMRTRDVQVRRPRAGGLYGLKPTFVRRLRGLEDRAVARGVSPNSLTVAAVGIGAVTGIALLAGNHVPVLWLAVPPLVLARMACNAVDGSLARRTGTSSARGAVLNELGDRSAD